MIILRMLKIIIPFKLGECSMQRSACKSSDLRGVGILVPFSATIMMPVSTRWYQPTP